MKDFQSDGEMVMSAGLNVGATPPEGE
ncbi:MAG: hypothetical protein QOG08_173, partial [Chloroflexota bacterium]|nr:hypothetical protein [Chloroflexota bacterium]